MIFDFLVIYRNASVLCQSECACLNKTVNMVVVSVNENTYPKRRAFMQCTQLSLKRKGGNGKTFNHMSTSQPAAG